MNLLWHLHVNYIFITTKKGEQYLIYKTYIMNLKCYHAYVPHQLLTDNNFIYI